MPPIYDNLVTDNNHLDGRPDCAPSHWKENFKIYYLTEKMRSQKDPLFGEVCDRVGKGSLLPKDEKFICSLIRKTPRENDNESFKSGAVSIIVKTNKKRERINNEKLDNLLPNAPSFICSYVSKHLRISTSLS